MKSINFPQSWGSGRLMKSINFPQTVLQMRKLGLWEVSQTYKTVIIKVVALKCCPPLFTRLSRTNKQIAATFTVAMQGQWSVCSEAKGLVLVAFPRHCLESLPEDLGACTIQR